MQIINSVFASNSLMVIFLTFWFYCCRLWVGLDAAISVAVFQVLILTILIKYEKNLKNLLNIYIKNKLTLLKAIIIITVLIISTNKTATTIIIAQWSLLFILFYIVINEKFIYFISLTLDIIILLLISKYIYILWVPIFPYLSDSLDYILNAQAFIQHLNDLPILTESFNLAGLNASGISTWSPGDPYSFSEVVGTKNYLYSIILGMNTNFGISLIDFQYIQLGFVAIGIAAWAYIAYKVFNSTNASILVVILCVLDSGITASILITWRESIVIYLLPIIIITMIKIFENSLYIVHWIFFSLILSITRVNLFLGIALILIPINLINLHEKKYNLFKSIRIMLKLILGLIIVLYASALLIRPIPSSFYDWTKLIFATPVATMQIFKESQVDKNLKNDTVDKNLKNDTIDSTSINKNNSSMVDSSIFNWVERLESRPFFRVLLDSVVATFFNPNPNWLRPSLNWEQAVFWTIPEETLLYPQMILIIYSTPFFIVGLFFVIRKKTTQEGLIVLLILMISILIVISAMVLYGSFSGRQRIQIIPIFYIFVVQGILILMRKLINLKYFSKKISIRELIKKIHNLD